MVIPVPFWVRQNWLKTPGLHFKNNCVKIDRRQNNERKYRIEEKEIIIKKIGKKNKDQATSSIF